MAVIEIYDPEVMARREARFDVCRNRFRHDMRTQRRGPGNWFPPHTHKWLTAKYLLHKRCKDCGTWRHLAIGHRGQLLAFEYVWPEGYRRAPGEGRMSGDELRLCEAEKYGTRLWSV